MEIEPKDVVKSALSFSHFCRHVFPLSFVSGYKNPSHWWKYDWIEDLENNTHTARLSARKHLKSTIMYAYLMWKLLGTTAEPVEALYLSFKHDLATYHTTNIKNHIIRNPYFVQFKDASYNSPSMVHYKTSVGGEFKIIPAGVLSFKRGMHPDVVVADDILADPTSTLNVTIIEKVGKAFFEDVMSLPKEGGELHLVGTSQHPTDLFFQIKDRARGFKWTMHKAILSETEKKTLWEEMFSYERLMEIKQQIKERAFNKEYMCSPVYSEDSFFRKEQILKLVNPELKKFHELKTKNDVFLGWDLGKKLHPSHVSILEKADGKFVQRYETWWDQRDYTWQLDRVKVLIPAFGVVKGYYDATRGELEMLEEQKKLPPQLKPMKFTERAKHSIAMTFERYVLEEKLELLPDDRQTNQILSVTNDLDAVRTVEGHGDSFWSNGMALAASETGDQFLMLTAIDWGKMEGGNDIEKDLENRAQVS